jgi:hypothetical protein
MLESYTKRNKPVNIFGWLGMFKLQNMFKDIPLNQKRLLYNILGYAVRLIQRQHWEMFNNDTTF